MDVAYEFMLCFQLDFVITTSTDIGESISWHRPDSVGEESPNTTNIQGANSFWNFPDTIGRQRNGPQRRKLLRSYDREQRCNEEVADLDLAYSYSVRRCRGEW